MFLHSDLVDDVYMKLPPDLSISNRNLTSIDFTIILIYVDDLLIVGDDLVEVNIVKEVLHSKLSIKDLGPLKYFLGFEIARSSNDISICQRKYSLDLLEDTRLLACKPISTPMDPTLELHLTSSLLF
uniref:Uncharacterized protein LOC113783963 n=1 Tax=Cicer arietinum TaxID=3827 RepID=A0A3Q7XQF7_CICAR|nr:uncharacterized protein LOC113783963 [Cicer arietinum]